MDDDELDDDFGCRRWDELKDRKRSSRIRGGSTQRILYDNHRKKLNKHHTFSLSYDVDKRESIEAQIRYLRSQMPFMNLDNDSGADDWKIRAPSYSLNKRKRWLLPDMLREVAANYQPPTDPKDTSHKAYDLFVNFNQPAQRGRDFITGYFDTRGLELTNPPGRGRRFNYYSLIATRDDLVTWRHQSRRQRRQRMPRRVDLAAYSRRRKPAKNGNRDRNSGIKRRNETFLDPVAQQVIERQNAIASRPTSQVHVEFSISQAYTRSMWPRINTDRLPFLRFTSKLHYSQRLVKKDKYVYWRSQRIWIRDRKRLLKKLFKRELRKEIDEEDRERHVKLEVTNEGEQIREYSLASNEVKQFALNDLIVPKTTIQRKHSNAKRRLQLIQQDEPKRIVYIEQTNEEVINNNEQDEEKETSSSSSSSSGVRVVADLIDLKVGIDVEFDEFIRSGKQTRLVDEWQPARVVIPIRAASSSCLIISLNELDRLVITVQCNPNVYESEFAIVKSKLLDANLSERCFSSIDELVEAVRPLIDDHQSTRVVAQNCTKQLFQLFGTNSSSELDSLVNEFEDDVFGKDQVNTRVVDKQLDDSSRECPICFEETTGEVHAIRLSACGHWACATCWSAYVRARLVDPSTSRRRIECLHDGCRTPLARHLLCTLVPAQLVSAYSRSCVETMIMRNGREFKLCQTANCRGVLRLGSATTNRLTTTVRCSCGAALCRVCSHAAHFPATCAQAKRMRDQLAAQEAAKKAKESLESMYESEGKNCPACGIYYEKNGGCLHMSCPCGEYFCWSCLKSVQGHGNSCSSVGLKKYEPEYFLDVQRKSTQRVYLEKIISEEREKRRMLTQRSIGSNLAVKYLKQIEHSNQIIPIGNNKIKETFVMGYDYLKDISYLNENLALLLTNSRSSVYKQVGKTSSYSYRPNLAGSLTRSLDLERRLECALFHSHRLDDYQQLVVLVRDLRVFAANLNHLLGYLGFH